MKIGDREVGSTHPTYTVAEIASNHDGSLDRACDLIRLAADCGADAAKLQYFRADTLVSDYGFRRLGKTGHQSGWTGSISDVFRRSEVPWEWTETLRRTCDERGIGFLASPYDLASVQHLAPYVHALKVGSGELTYPPLLEAVGATGLPVLIGTGAATSMEVVSAVQWSGVPHDRLCVMQCTTNYSGDPSVVEAANLRVLHSYRVMFPHAVLGLSDHTVSLAVAVGAVALGARVVERHFTDDRTLVGPDHPFAMDGERWQRMVTELRAVEKALGSHDKQVALAESETVVIQRRCLRAARDLAPGTVLTVNDVVPLRPCPPEALPPFHLAAVVGRTLTQPLAEGEHLTMGVLA